MSDFEKSLAAYRRLIERASEALAAAGEDEEQDDPELDPAPCP